MHVVGFWNLERQGYRIPQGADPFDREFHHVARLEPAADRLGGEFENAPGAHGSGTDHVAGAQFGIAAGVGQELRPRPVHTSGVAVGVLLAVHRGGHLEMEATIAVDIVQIGEGNQARAQ